MNAWTDLEYPLSLRDMKQLTWFQGKIAATVWLHEQHLYEDRQQAARLSFARWLVTIGALNEFGMREP